MASLVAVMPASAAAQPVGQGDSTGEGARAVATFSTSDIKQARDRGKIERRAASAEGRAERDHTEKDKLRAELVSRSAEVGLVVDPETVDVFELADGQIIATVPEAVEIDEIVVIAEGDTLTLESTSSESDTPVLTAGGPGMASWTYDGSGWYYLTIKVGGSQTVAQGEFFWEREKTTNYSSSYDFYSYDRQAIGRPKVSGVGIKTLRIQNYPYDSVEAGLLDWMQFKPSTNFSLCSDSNYTVSITSPIGLGLSSAFQRCGDYTYWRNIYNPGSYWLQRDGKAYAGKDIQADYVWSIKTKKGAKASMHDFQRLIIVNLHGISFECSRYDSGGTCSY